MSEPCLRCAVHGSTEWTCTCDRDCGHPLCAERPDPAPAGDRLGPSSSPAELAEVLRQVAERFPDARLVRNQVGNLSIMVPQDEGWRWAGYVDLMQPGWEAE